MRQYLENGKRCVQRPKLLLVTNRKVHMRFRLAPRSMTLYDLELYKFEFSENLSGFRRFRTQQQLNEWRQTSIVSDNQGWNCRGWGWTPRSCLQTLIF